MYGMERKHRPRAPDVYMIDISGPDVTAFRTTACTATHMKLAQANATVECIFFDRTLCPLRNDRPLTENGRKMSDVRTLFCSLGYNLKSISSLHKFTRMLPLTSLDHSVVSNSLWLVMSWLVMSCSTTITTRSFFEVLRESPNHSNAQLGSTSCLLVLFQTLITITLTVFTLSLGL